MLYSCEMPLVWMKKYHDEFNDYLYVLLHLYLQNSEYKQFCLEYRSKPDSIVYLDNSAHELGESMDSQLLYDVCCELQPDFVMLPDKLNDYDVTLDRTEAFINDYGTKLPSATKMMGIIQGKNFKELANSYLWMENWSLPAIGIPFIFATADKRDSTAQMLERAKFLHSLTRWEQTGAPVVNPKIHHHLLGTWCTAEFALYRTLGYNWIKSFDTSNPIMAAIEGQCYKGSGLPNKPQTKLDQVFNWKEGQLQPYLESARFNVNQLRRSLL